MHLSSALLFGIKLIKNPTRSAWFYVLTIKNALNIQITDRERKVIIKKINGEVLFFLK